MWGWRENSAAKVGCFCAGQNLCSTERCGLCDSLWANLARIRGAAHTDRQTHDEHWRLAEGASRRPPALSQASLAVYNFVSSLQPVEQNLPPPSAGRDAMKQETRPRRPTAATAAAAAAGATTWLLQVSRARQPCQCMRNPPKATEHRERIRSTCQNSIVRCYFICRPTPVKL